MNNFIKDVMEYKFVFSNESSIFDRFVELYKDGTLERLKEQVILQSYKAEYNPIIIETDQNCIIYVIEDMNNKVLIKHKLKLRLQTIRDGVNKVFLFTYK